MAKRHITNHGKKRIRERVGAHNADNAFKLARKNGKSYLEFDGEYRKFLDYLAIKSKGKIIVYNGNIYISKGKTLITVLNVPIRYKGIK